MIPAQADIDQALDVLDWCDLPAIAELRGHVSRLIRDVKHGHRPGERRASRADDGWTPVGRALLYVLWVTSDEYLGTVYTAPSPH